MKIYLVGNMRRGRFEIGSMRIFSNMEEVIKYKYGSYQAAVKQVQNMWYVPNVYEFEINSAGTAPRKIRLNEFKHIVQSIAAFHSTQP